MNPTEVISGLEYLLEESKVAKSTLIASYENDRLKQRVIALEEELAELKIFIKSRLK